ncbi:NADPH:adrenodoxin oxidoreductase protein, partial [Thalictrum thalictroides]
MKHEETYATNQPCFILFAFNTFGFLALEAVDLLMRLQRIMDNNVMIAGGIVVNQFSRVALNERFSFFGNVSLGSSVSLSELREMYHVVVLAYGAESDRILGIPGEELKGIYSAREFVWWYNGHPDCSDLDPDLKSTDTAVILGQGNVALDVARILLRPTSELAKTDIADHALASLQESSI